MIFSKNAKVVFRIDRKAYLRHRPTLHCLFGMQACIQVIGSGTAPVYVENLILDGSSRNASFIHIMSVSDRETHAPIVLRDVTFQSLVSSQAAIVSEASPLTFIDCTFLNMSVKALVHIKYNDFFKWQDGSVYTICDSSNVYIPLVFRNTQMENVYGFDVLWGENKQPVIAQANSSNLVRIIQTNDLSTREPFQETAACLKQFPNCCKKSPLEDLSKTQIYAGIQYTNAYFNVSTELPTNILSVRNMTASTCPERTSWQYELDYIKCKPIPCPAGQDVHGYMCRDCPAGWFKRTTGIESCTPCPSNTYANSNGSTTCLECPANSKTNETGASSIARCICDEGRIREDDVCVLCQEGTVMVPDATGKLVCRPCPKGTFQNAKGQEECGAPTPPLFPPPLSSLFSIILLYIPKNMQEKTVMTKMEDEHHWKTKFN